MSGLSKEAKFFVENAEPLKFLHEKNYNEAREIMNNTVPFEGKLNPINHIKDETIKVEDGEITLRIYTPKGEGPFPIIIYFHGGGWVTGSIETSHVTCHMLCEITNHIIVSVDYRLAPEHPFPTPVEDAYEAFSWVYENAKDLNGVPADISVAGDSSGGNLATVTAIAARENKGPNITAQILIYPVTDLSMESDSYEKYAEGYGLTKNLMQWCIDYYLENKNNADNPIASPLFHNNLTDLPPTFILTAQYDVLRDEGNRYAHRLSHAGVSVTHIEKEGLVHAFFTEPSIFYKQINETIYEIDAFLKSVKKSSDGN